MKKIIILIVVLVMTMLPVSVNAEEGTAPIVETQEVTVVIGQPVTIAVSGMIGAEVRDLSLLDLYFNETSIKLVGRDTGTTEVYILGPHCDDVTIKVTIVKPIPAPTISSTNMTVEYNKTGSIQYWGFPCNGNHVYDVKSSNNNVVSFYEGDLWYDGKYGYDENGRDIHTAYFDACGYGTATITVSDGTYAKTCKVTVPDRRVRLNKTSVRLKKGKKITLKVLNAPGKVTWKSSKKKVATVSKKGVVKAKKKGTAIITAKVNGKTYKCKIKVVKK